VQVDPIKPTLKAPGAKRWKLEHEKLLSNFDVNFNVRRYSSVKLKDSVFRRCEAALGGGVAAFDASLLVGRCRLTISNPHWKRLDVRA